MSIQTKWNYHLTGIMASKALSRPGTTREYASEITGYDGSTLDGLRPLSGFKRVHELDCTADENHDERSRVTDFFPFDIRVGPTEYAYGFVYRAVRPDAPLLADVFVDVWDSESALWDKGVKLMEGVDFEAQMDVVAEGRYLFALVEGRPPALFYFDGIEAPFTPVQLGVTTAGPFPGPGIRPTCVEHAKWDGVVGSTTTPADTDQPAAGQVYLTPIKPSLNEIFDFEAGPGSGEGSGSPSSSGPSSPLERDGLARKLGVGDYAFAYRLQDTRTGRWSGLSYIAPLREIDFTVQVGDDTATKKQYAVLEVVYDGSKFDRVHMYRSLNVKAAGGVQSAGILFTDRIVDPSEWWTEKTAPGGQFDPEAGDWRQAAIYYSLDDLQLAPQPVYLSRPWFDEVMPRAGTACMYEGALMCAKITDQPESARGLTLPGDTARGLGEIRWSDTMERSPELFPPENRFVPTTPSNQVVRLVRCGNAALGFAKDRVYHIRRSAGYMKIDEILDGYGVTGHKAADSVGGMCFFVTPKGLKSVASDGQLDDYTHLDHLLIREWAGELDGVSVSHDPYMSAVFVLNPERAQAAVLWMSTGRLTEIHDAWFDECRTGAWPVAWDDATDAGNQLTKRTLFLQNAPDGEPSEDWLPRVFIVDHDRRKAIADGHADANGLARLTTMDGTGDGVHVVASYAGGTVDVSGSGTVVGTGWENGFLYVLRSSTVTVGTKARIKGTGVGTIEVVADDTGELTGLAEGDVVGTSPVYQRWIGAPVRPQDEQGNEFGRDLFRSRQVSSLGTYFVGVAGPPETAYPEAALPVRFFQGNVWRGAEDEPAARGLGRDADDTWAETVVDGESVVNVAFGGSAEGRYGIENSVLAPSIEVFSPDVDYNLLAVQVTGSINDTTRSRLPS